MRCTVKGKRRAFRYSQSGVVPSWEAASSTLRRRDGVVAGCGSAVPPITRRAAALACNAAASATNPGSAASGSASTASTEGSASMAPIGGTSELEPARCRFTRVSPPAHGSHTRRAARWTRRSMTASGSRYVLHASLEPASSKLVEETGDHSIVLTGSRTFREPEGAIQCR